MQRYLMNFDTRRMETRQTECLVIGSGVAGLTAACQLARHGHHVLLVVRDTLQDSNTSKAQGGIAAALGMDDNPELHLADTLVAGAGLSNESVSRMVVTEGPQDIRWLAENGAEFDHNADGTLSLGREGCHSRNRIVHSHGDATGAEVARALNAMAAREKNIRTLEGCYVVDLLVHQGRCYGVTALWHGRKICLRAKHTVLATGGLGRLFQHTTNPEGATGSGMAMAARAGAELTDMEFVQFHPTALALKGCPNFLISEAVRGAGAYLLNSEGKRFMPERHPLAELAPRDVVARCIFQEMTRAETSHIWLDARHIEKVTEKFPMIAATCRDYGVDIEKDLIPIAPAAHYMMGGVHTDIWGRTNIEALYACGETACTGLQGANRLASNSLLEGLVFGRRVATIIGKTRLPQAEAGLFWREESLAAEKHAGVLADREAGQQILSRYLGITREAQEMSVGEEKLSQLSASYEGTSADTPAELDLRSALLCGALIFHGAQRRRESRGAHYRSDYPDKDEFLRQHFGDRRKVYDEAERFGEENIAAAVTLGMV
ncbi:L-aspartate oxidase [Selenomonas ruminantium]|uniref:L-aspartate oxidase n=1 Tax=Selenomonas ruminantium TaxID=971 RepID=A0A1H0MEW1_SELRU|nr:L-aspartate oxidase [Selenomonas ruminantium]SDO78989.1 L-aspartate oxidase [Selenomonas ruminantium]